jgi:hypothetical protein
VLRRRRRESRVRAHNPRENRHPARARQEVVPRRPRLLQARCRGAGQATVAAEDAQPHVAGRLACRRRRARHCPRGTSSPPPGIPTEPARRSAAAVASVPARFGGAAAASRARRRRSLSCRRLRRGRRAGRRRRCRAHVQGCVRHDGDCDAVCSRAGGSWRHRRGADSAQVAIHTRCEDGVRQWRRCAAASSRRFSQASQAR